MKKLLALLILISTPALAATELRDEGTSQGYINVIDCVGAGVSCSKSGIVGTATISGGGSSNTLISGDNIQITTTGTNSVIRIPQSADDTTLVSNGTNYIGTAITNCTDTGGNHLNYTAASNAFSCGTSSGPASPAGTDKNVQFNDGGSTGADSPFQYSKDSNTLVISGDVGQPGTQLAIVVSSDAGIPVANVSHDGSAFFNKVQLSNDLAVADGGTGLSSGTSGGVLAYTAAGTLASSAALTANAVVIGGGAGAVPTTITADTTTTHSLFATSGSPAFRNINMTDLNGTLGVSNGGTGSTSGTALRMAYYPTATSIASVGGLISTDGTRLAIGPGTSTAISLDVAGAIRSVPLALTDGSSIAIDLSRSNLFTVTLTGQPRTLANFTNGAPGQKFVVYVSQDSSGSRKMGFGANYMFGSTITSYDATTTAGMHDWVGFIVNQSGVSADVVAVSQGYR